MSEEKAETNKEESEKISESLLETRSLIISSPVDAKLADQCMKYILLLEQKDPEKEIRVFINSPGGEVYSGMAIFDLLQFVACPVCTIVCGLAASMGSVLSLAGDKGRKFALPNSRIMIHQPSLSGAQGVITDLETHAKQIIKTREHFAQMYANLTGKTMKKIIKDMDRDHWLNADEAVTYGLIDKVISTAKEL